LEEDLGIDSLDKWELLARIEEEFNISLGWESLQKVDTVSSLYDMVSDALKSL
jgi:acyl carrier protein